jgi:hypothetical protein
MSCNAIRRLIIGNCFQGLIETAGAWHLFGVPGDCTGTVSDSGSNTKCREDVCTA